MQSLGPGVVLEVDLESLIGDEQLGTNPKVWFLRNEDEWLFKDFAPADVVKGALAHTVVAAVGPVVTQALARSGVEASRAEGIVLYKAADLGNLTAASGPGYTCHRARERNRPSCR